MSDRLERIRGLALHKASELQPLASLGPTVTHENGHWRLTVDGQDFGDMVVATWIRGTMGRVRLVVHCLASSRTHYFSPWLGEYNYASLAALIAEEVKWWQLRNRRLH